MIRVVMSDLMSYVSIYHLYDFAVPVNNAVTIASKLSSLLCKRGSVDRI